MADARPSACSISRLSLVVRRFNGLVATFPHVRALSLLFFAVSLQSSVSSTSAGDLGSPGVTIEARGTASSTGDERQRTPLPHQSPSLPNALWVHDGLMSGGQPQGADGFGELQRLGFRTVISVDGICPDVETARRFNLRYVHLPHGYDSVSIQRRQELALAFVTLPGPVYVHCHHGKHRSPAAAACGAIAAGLISPQQGIRVLQQAGTADDYQGLWISVRETTQNDLSELRALDVQFRETVEPPALIQAMGQLEAAIERLERMKQHNWDVDPQHPDLTPQHEALLLFERLTELQRLPTMAARPPEFRELVDESRTQARLLQSLLNSPGAGETAASIPTETKPGSVLQTLRRLCRECHQRFRD